MLGHRLGKNGLEAIFSTRDSSNFFRAIGDSNHGAAFISHVEWRQIICDNIAASQDNTTKQQVSRWRQAGGEVDHRIFPYIAAVTGCVVVIWPAKITRELTFFPPACTRDTKIIHFRWFNQNGCGNLDTLEALQAQNPMQQSELTRVVQARVEQHTQATRALPRAVAPTTPIGTPVTLRQMDASIMQHHSRWCATGAKDDSRWGFQANATAELESENMGEFLHAYASSRTDVYTRWDKHIKQPRVWCVSSQLDPLLRREGVTGLCRWGRKLDLSKLEIITVPINHEGYGVMRKRGHWTALIIRVQEGVMQAYDLWSSRVGQGEGHPHEAILNRVGEWVQQLNTKRRMRSGQRAA